MEANHDRRMHTATYNIDTVIMIAKLSYVR